MINSIQVKTDLNDIDALEATSIDLAIKLEAKSFSLEKMTFRIALCEHEMPEDDGGYDEYLFYPSHDEHGQQSKIDEQIKLPKTIDGETEINLTVDLYGFKCNSNNLFDVIKNMPDYILDKHEKIDLYVECIVNHELDSEESKHVIVPFPNPFYPFT